MDIKNIINNYGYLGHMHGNGLVNHLPMSQFSLYKLGATEKQIIDCTESNIEKWGLKPAEDLPYKIEKIEDALGLTYTFSAFNKFFSDETSKKGVDKVIKESLNKMSKGLGTGLFHGIIRVAYGVESNNIEEICRGLSLYSSLYYEADFAEKSVPISSLTDELSNFMANKKNDFYLEGSPDDKEVALFKALYDLYLVTGSFYVLHSITGLHALVILKEYYDDYNNVLDRYTVCVLNVLLRVRAKEIKDTTLDHKDHSWEEIFSLGTTVNDVHTHKFIYTSYCLSKLYNLSNFRNAANVKLQKDHNL